LFSTQVLLNECHRSSYLAYHRLFLAYNGQFELGGPHKLSKCRSWKLIALHYITEMFTSLTWWLNTLLQRAHLANSQLTNLHARSLTIAQRSYNLQVALETGDTFIYGSIHYKLNRILFNTDPISARVGKLTKYLLLKLIYSSDESLNGLLPNEWPAETVSILRLIYHSTWYFM